MEDDAKVTLVEEAGLAEERARFPKKTYKELETLPEELETLPEEVERTKKRRV